MNYTTEEMITNAIAWIEDLLTTEEKQGEGMLGDSEVGYCCLGRAGVVSGVDFNGKHGSSYPLTRSVGLFTSFGRFSDEYHHFISRDNGNEISAISLTDLNDAVGLSFKEIAEFILNLDDLSILFVPEVAKGIKVYAEEKNTTVG